MGLGLISADAVAAASSSVEEGARRSLDDEEVWERAPPSVFRRLGLAAEVKAASLPGAMVIRRFRGYKGLGGTVEEISRWAM